MTYGPIANEAVVCKLFFTVIYSKKHILSQNSIFTGKKISRNNAYPM